MFIWKIIKKHFSLSIDRIGLYKTKNPTFKRDFLFCTCLKFTSRPEFISGSHMLSDDMQSIYRSYEMLKQVQHDILYA
jgi:hypothetical protein